MPEITRWPGMPAATTPQDKLRIIIARNEDRKRAKGALPEQLYRVEYDDDHDEDGSNWAHWPAWLTSDPRFPSDAIANFTEVEIDDAIAEAIAFCCNDRPEDDIAALARMLADEQAAHAETRRVVAHHRQAATRWTNHAGVVTEQLTDALAILDEVARLGNLWPAQQLRVLKIRAAISGLYQGDEPTTTNGQSGEEAANATV